MQGRNGDADVENGLVDTVRERKSGMNGESSIRIYTVPCVTWRAGKKLLSNTGSPAWSTVMTSRGGMGEGGGGSVGRGYVYNCG